MKDVQFTAHYIGRHRISFYRYFASSLRGKRADRRGVRVVYVSIFQLRLGSKRTAVASVKLHKTATRNDTLIQFARGREAAEETYRHPNINE